MNSSPTSSVDFLGHRLSLIDRASLLSAVDEAVSAHQPTYLAMLNASKVVTGANDVEFRELLNRFDLLAADGMSVVWGTRLLGLATLERITGIDFMQDVVARAEVRGWRVYFLGATRDVLRDMRTRLRARHPRLQIAGMRDGYHGSERDPEVAAEVRASGADVIFVGMPSPRKESFLMSQREWLGVSFAMGVGGSFDVLAGRVRRAPTLIQRVGLEWAYRLMQEPGRLWRRYLVSNGRFAYLLARERLRGRATRGGI